MKPVADMIRVNRVANGYVVSSRRAGVAPSTYRYTDRAIARTVDEVVDVVRALLGEKAYELKDQIDSEEARCLVQGVEDVRAGRVRPLKDINTKLRRTRR